MPLISGYSTSFRNSTGVHPPTSALAESGFTLLELLLVLSIIGLVSVMVLPDSGNLDARSFSARVRQVSSLLNSARRDAVVRGHPSTVRLFAGEAGAAQLAEAARREANPGPYLLTGWESGAIRLSFRDSTGKLSEIEDSIDIRFFPQGGSTGGTVLLAREDQRARLVIDTFTGRIHREPQE